MNKIYKSFVVVFILTVVIAVAGVAWYRVSRQEIVVDNSTDVESKEVVVPPPTAVAKDEPVEGADPRVLLYSNGRHAGDVRYYGSEPDVINIRDALTKQTIATVKTNITPDIRGASNLYYLVGEKIYFYNQTDRQIEVLDFSGNLLKLTFTESPVNRSYHNFIISNDGKKIAWARSTKGKGNNLRTAMWAANIDGSEQKLLQEKEVGPEKYFSLFKFSKDNSSIFYSEEAGGRDGYILFSGSSNLYTINLSDAKVAPIFTEPNKGYVGSMSMDEQYLAIVVAVNDQANQRVEVKDVTSGTLVETFPFSEGFTTAGNIAFSPDGDWVVYTEALGNPNKEQFQIKAGKLGSANPDNKTQNLVASSSSLYRVERWITNNLILLSNDLEPGARYIIRADSTGLVGL